MRTDVAIRMRRTIAMDDKIEIIITAFIITAMIQGHKIENN